jgi:hypothetical protein
MNHAISFMALPNGTLLASTAIFIDDRDEPLAESLAVVTPRQLPILPDDYWRWASQLLERTSQDFLND